MGDDSMDDWLVEYELIEKTLQALPRIVDHRFHECKDGGFSRALIARVKVVH
jgi:hypothetical protein